MKENPLRTYTSKKPQGQIYHISTQLKEMPFITNQCLYDPRLFLDDMYEYITEARNSKEKYNHGLRILMGQYSVRTEIEFISGYIVQWPKYLSTKDRHNFIERIKSAYIRFKREWRHHFELEFAGYQGPDLQEKMKAKTAAWYYVTYHRSEYKSDVTYNTTLSRYMSFPWVLDDYIVNIAYHNDTRPMKYYYSEAIPAEKIENATKKDNLLLVSDDDSDDESDEDDNISS